MKNLKYAMVLLTFLGGITSADATNIEFTATTTGDVTPRWWFEGEVIDVWVDGVDTGDLTSGVEKTIAVINGDVISYRTTGDWTGVTRIEMNNDPISGSIAGLSQLTSLTQLKLHATSVSGDISSLSNLTSLATLIFYSTSVSGNLSNLSGLTLLAYLDFHSTAISADANCLDTQVLLTLFRAEGCTWTQIEVDNALTSLVVNEAAGDAGRDCVVNVGGNNANPSILGLNSKELLEARGWTVEFSAFTTVYANGLIDNVMLFSRELDQHDIDYLWNNGDGREDWEPFLGRLNRPLDYPLRRGRYTF